MEIHTYEVKLPSYAQPWRIYPIGDMHFSHQGCDRACLRRDIKEIEADENAYWFGMGDYDEYINFKDPRFDPSSFTKDERIDFLKSMGQKQTRRIVQLFEPIKHKCIGIVEGNHELAFRNHNDFDPAPEIAERLETKYLSYEALTRIYVSGPDGRKRYSVVIFTHHGWGGGDTAGAGLNRMERLAITWDADIYITGHDHKLSSGIKPRLGINTSGKYTDKPIAFINSGTYLKTKQIGIQGYEVKRGGKPTPIGCSHITIWGNGERNFGMELAIKHNGRV